MKQTVMDDRPFLLSKSTVPVAPANLVARPRLTAMLDEGSHLVTVVVAPAGWGRTTLLSHWARTLADREVVGWLTLDSTDDDPMRFWVHLITSLRRAGSSVGESALSALGVPGLDPLESRSPG